ncbi:MULTISPECIES: hypothetical protein [unclassified Streptomyces]|uniref:hypothetical protein n=1 Tax=unclassified Streptomyces TaxID=2593676 RepID=UPI0022AF01B8|nr:MULTISPECIES: hypothetical protein [unclassified Streptomyces]MCZ4123922.1 hypothetical protein [Streptomyces sp. H39-S7]MDF9814201.1 ABC-type proline/glycine betaine transport system permease subunit [Streptomyces sp. SPB162]
MNPTINWSALAISSAVLLPLSILPLLGAPLPQLASRFTHRRILRLCALLYNGVVAVNTIPRLAHAQVDILMLCTGIGIAMALLTLTLTTIAAVVQPGSARPRP